MSCSSLSQQGQEKSLINDYRRKTVYFDEAFGKDESHDKVHSLAIEPTLKYFMDGYNVSFITIGQTDSGKTYLLHGPKAGKTQNGLLSSISNSIFENLSKKSSHNGFSYSGQDRVGLQVYEIYSELARDLLDPSRDSLTIEMDDKEGACVKGLSTKWVSSAIELNQWINLVMISKCLYLKCHLNISIRIGSIKQGRRK